MKIKGIMMLSEPLHCREDALTSYDCNVDGVPITIHFPLYFFRERGLSENKLDPPEIGKGLRREHSKIDWGYLAQYCIHPPTDKNEYVLAVVNTIAIEFEGDEELAQYVYKRFDQFFERFEYYCLLANRQLLYTPDTKTKGEPRLELISENGYIYPIDQRITVGMSVVTEESCITKKDIEKAIKYASSSCSIRPEYKFMYQAYEAEKKQEHRLSIINACSALEMCLLNSIEGYCSEHGIDSELITRKYRYLGEMVEFLARVDEGFVAMKTPLQENAVKLRNDVLHCNRNPYPTAQEAKSAILLINKALTYFYEDYCK